MYNPEQLVGAARTTAVKSFGSAGTSSSRMAKQFPALSGYGIAQVRGAQSSSLRRLLTASCRRTRACFPVLAV